MTNRQDIAYIVQIERLVGRNNTRNCNYIQSPVENHFHKPINSSRARTS